jgi:hypothetical protein
MMMSFRPCWLQEVFGPPLLLLQKLRTAVVTEPSRLEGWGPPVRRRRRRDQWEGLEAATEAWVLLL